MAFTLADFNDLLSLDPTDSYNQGTLRAIRMQKVGRDDNRLAVLLDKLQSTPTRPTPPPAQQVPWAHLHASPVDQREPLNTVKLAILDRISRDPEQVTDEQVLTLAKWTMNAEFGSDDAKLLHLVFDPIAEYHERKVLLANEKAKAAMKNVPIPDIPAEAHELVSDLIAAEMPDLRGYEVAERAREFISAADARRRGQEAPAAPAAPSVGERAAQRHSSFAPPTY